MLFFRLQMDESLAVAAPGCKRCPFTIVYTRIYQQK
nr:MAG TPA: hypothetical protein [Caudoviricetes sp.]